MLGEVCCNNLAVSKFAADDPPVDSVTSLLELELAELTYRKIASINARY